MLAWNSMTSLFLKVGQASSLAYAENFHVGGFIQWHMLVICIWCALFLTSQFTSYSCFQSNVLATFIETICIFLYTQFPYFMCHCTEYKLSALQVMISKKNTLNATTQQFITAKISGCALKPGSKTHSSLRQSNFLFYAGNKVFVTYQTQWGVNPNPPWLRPWASYDTARLIEIQRCASRKNFECDKNWVWNSHVILLRILKRLAVALDIDYSSSQPLLWLVGKRWIKECCKG